MRRRALAFSTLFTSAVVAIVAVFAVVAFARILTDVSDALQVVLGVHVRLGGGAPTPTSTGRGTPSERGASAGADASSDVRALLEQRLEATRAFMLHGAPNDIVMQSVGSTLDEDEFARRAFGKTCPSKIPCVNHWDVLTGDRQREVATLLGRICEKTVRNRLRDTLGNEMFYGNGVAQNSGFWTVPTSVSSRADPRGPVRVDYVVRASGDRPVVDVVVEGSSMTKNYYDQFHAMLTRPDQGYAYLVQKLEAKLARL